jgi:hypothetical protein
MLRTSDYFFLAAVLISFLLSVVLWFSGEKDLGLFVGLWVPSLLSLGCYFNIVSKRGNL